MASALGSPPLLPTEANIKEGLSIKILTDSAYGGPEDKKIQTTPPKTPPAEREHPVQPVAFHHKTESRIVSQGEFEPEQHFYPRVLNAQIHPLVQSFFTLGNERIIARYTHLNPQVKVEDLKNILSYTPKHFQWAGK